MKDVLQTARILRETNTSAFKLTYLPKLGLVNKKQDM